MSVRPNLASSLPRPFSKNVRCSKKKKARLIVIKQNLDLNPEQKNNVSNKILITVFSILAELERDFISERTKEGFFVKGSISYVLHPNITGIIFFLMGLQILAFGGVGSEWTFIGLSVSTFIIYKILIPKIESKLRKKYPDFSSDIDKMPKLISLRKVS